MIKCLYNKHLKFQFELTLNTAIENFSLVQRVFGSSMFIELDSTH